MKNPLNPTFGSVINDSLFELNTDLNEIRISDEIKNSLQNYEPRISGIFSQLYQFILIQMK